MSCSEIREPCPRSQLSRQCIFQPADPRLASERVLILQMDTDGAGLLVAWELPADAQPLSEVFSDPGSELVPANSSDALRYDLYTDVHMPIGES